MRQARQGVADDFSETVLILALCLAVSLLIYIRTRIVDGIRRNQQQPEGGRPPEQNNGVFPAAGDVAREEWAVQR